MKRIQVRVVATNAALREQTDAQELTARLRQAIGQLPPQEAKAFCLRYFSELSYREVNIRANAAGQLDAESFSQHVNVLTYESPGLKTEGDTPGRQR